MRYRLRSWYVGLSATALIVCAVRDAAAQNDTTLNQFQSGYAVLNCGPSCQLNWSAQRPQALALYNSGQWQNLGVAAEMLGYPDAAQCYYGARESLSASGLACATETTVPQAVQALGQILSQMFNAPSPTSGNACDGFVFPAAAQLGLANAIAEAVPRRVVRHRVYRRTSHTATSAPPALSSSGIVEASASAANPAPASSSGIVEAK
jgi:hypothetical protein